MAGLLNRVLVQVSGKNAQLEFLRRLERFHHLLEHHGQRIAFFPGGATRHPSPQHMAGWPAGQQGREDPCSQLLPGGPVAKETRHPDQQLLEQQIQLLRVFLQVTDIGRNLVYLVDTHAALDPPIEGIFLVQRKIMAGVGSQQNDGLFQGAPRLVFQRQFGSLRQWCAL